MERHKKWEYKQVERRYGRSHLGESWLVQESGKKEVIDLDRGEPKSTFSFIDRLNELGEDGWELVSDVQEGKYRCVLLKREK